MKRDLTGVGGGRGGENGSETGLVKKGKQKSTTQDRCQPHPSFEG